MMPRTESTSEFQPLEDKEVEYFFASDASAVIEHTNRVIYLEVSVLVLVTILKFLILKRYSAKLSLWTKKPSKIEQII